MQNIKVERAIILAAGLGSRMLPVTEYLPKPLVKVLGKRIMETSLDALLASGIEEIYVVCGYLADKFQCLRDNYPMIRFVINDNYKHANNISSVLCVKDLIRNAYVIEGDLLLKNSDVITPFQSESNYLAFPVRHTNDWCFYTDQNGYIRDLRIGGSDCYQMVGISYWTEEDGEKLAEHAEWVFSSPDGKEKYWDEIALSVFKSEYKIRVRECKPEDVIEIDTLEELQSIDPIYRKGSVLDGFDQT